MATYAQLSDVELDLGRPVPVESSQDVQELLDAAEIQLAAYAGDLAVRITAELTTAENVKTAVVGMVVTAMRAETTQQLLLAGSTTAAERSSIRRQLVVGRRERFLVGIPTAAWSIDMSEADYTLSRPTRPAPPRRYWGRGRWR